MLALRAVAPWVVVLVLHFLPYLTMRGTAPAGAVVPFVLLDLYLAWRIGKGSVRAWSVLLTLDAIAVALGTLGLVGSATSEAVSTDYTWTTLLLLVLAMAHLALAGRPLRLVVSG